MSRMTLDDARRLMVLLQETAQKMMVPYFGALNDEQISRKADTSIVTIVDNLVEDHLTQLLPQLFPGSDVIGEESVEQDPAILDRFSSGKALWVIDPLDGTAAFTRGETTWGPLLTYIEEGMPQAAWILNGATGDHIIALRDHGVYLNGERVPSWQEEERLPLRQMAGGKWDRRNAALIEAHVNNEKYFQKIDPHFPTAVFLPFSFLRDGLSFFSTAAKRPWDILPTIVMVEAMGGRAAWSRDGTPICGEAMIHPKEPVLFVRHADQWEAVRDALFDGVDLSCLSRSHKT